MTHTPEVSIFQSQEEKGMLCQCGQASGTLFSDVKQTLRIHDEDSSGVEYPEGHKDGTQNGGDQSGPEGETGTTAQKASNVDLRG